MRSFVRRPHPVDAVTQHAPGWLLWVAHDMAPGPVSDPDPADLLTLDVVEDSSSFDGFTVIATAAIPR